MREPSLSSPFVDTASFEAPSGRNGHGPSSPFVEGLLLESLDGGGDGEGLERLVASELYDDELDAALYEMVGNTARSVDPMDHARVSRAALARRIAPLEEAVDQLLEQTATALEGRDPLGLTEAEIDAAVDPFSSEAVDPEFENFFGALKKAVKRVAKGAIKLAKKGVRAATALGLGPLIRRLKPYLRRLIRGVLARAIRRLPPSLQPAARSLARRYGLRRETAEELDESGDPALDVSELQLEFVDGAAGMLLGREDAPESENEEREADSEPGYGLRALDAARERFVADLEALDEGEDPTPAVERFLPAILPIVRLGIKLVGRKRVIGIISGLVAKLIARFVGRRTARPLARALVDSGFRLMGLEVSEEAALHTANLALASTVEETVRAVAAQPDSVLDNETLLEGAVLQAFEQAAVANLPAMLPGSVYRRRPDLVETDGRQGTWVPLPARGPVRVKKHSRCFRARITPRKAMAIRTFGEASLADYLQEHLGLDAGEELEGDVHLYEAVPGTVLGELGQLEGEHDDVSAEDFHPLTAEAAALLTGEAGLARPGTPATRSAPHRLVVGQRFYRIALPGRRIGFAGRGRRRPRKSQVDMLVDFPGNRIVVRIYLGERRAQELAAEQGKGGHAGVTVARLASLIDRGIGAALGGAVVGRVKILHEAVGPRASRGAALRRVAPVVAERLASRVSAWSRTALAELLTKSPDKLLAAAQDADDGVSFVVTIATPPGLGALRSALAGNSADDDLLAGDPTGVTADVKPGLVDV